MADITQDQKTKARTQMKEERGAETEEQDSKKKEITKKKGGGANSTTSPARVTDANILQQLAQGLGHDMSRFVFTRAGQDHAQSLARHR